MQAQWEEKLAAYVQDLLRGDDACGLRPERHPICQQRVTTALIIFFGAKAVIDGEMTVGELIAFNMIASQVAQPILRLSQLWQDFQQVQISVERLGDILNAPPEIVPQDQLVACRRSRGAIELRNGHVPLQARHARSSRESLARRSSPAR